MSEWLISFGFKASASVGRLSIYFLSRHTAKSCLFNYLTFEFNSYQYSVKKLLKQTTLLFGAAHFVFKVLLDVLVVHMVLFIISTRCRPGQIIINWEVFILQKKCQVAFAKLVFVRMVPGLQNDIALAEVALDILTHLNKNIKTSPYKKWGGQLIYFRCFFPFFWTQNQVYCRQAGN